MSKPAIPSSRRYALVTPSRWRHRFIFNSYRPKATTTHACTSYHQLATTSEVTAPLCSCLALPRLMPPVLALGRNGREPDHDQSHRPPRRVWDSTRLRASHKL
nr:unnamed protein product [Digitaria exilis]